MGIIEYGMFEIDKKYFRISRRTYFSGLGLLLVKFLLASCRSPVGLFLDICRFLVKFLSVSCQVLIVMVRLMDEILTNCELVPSSNYKL